MEHQKSAECPVLLSGDTFTPPSRTPWGGERIRALKGLPEGPIVGESWELSVEPSFPSRLSSGVPLGDWLGPGGTPLLVKLLDTQDRLSLQIHPSDDDPALAADESGKPESWYVVDREPGAGLFLGLTPGTDRVTVEAALDRREGLEALLPFVPVEPGDFFVIEAGTPHCIGPGVFLVEPQRVMPGRRGLTYRYWDWDRRYDADGKRDPNGEPRALHRERALAVTNFAGATDPRLLDRIRHRAGDVDVEAPAHVTPLGGPEAPVASSSLRVARLAGDGAVALPDDPALVALTVLAGEVTLGDVVVPVGRTAAVPSGWQPREAHLVRAHALLSSVVP